MTRTVLRGGLGILISVAALAFVISRVDLAGVAKVLGSANLAFVGAMLACTILDLVCRTIRWQALLAPIQRVRFLPTMGYLLVGYVANNLLPARLGELVRSHYLGDREGISRATALGTIVVERVVDTAVLVALASAAIVVLGVRGVVANAILVGLALTVLLVLALTLALVAHRLPFADRLVAAVERWPAVIRLAGRLRGGLAVAGRPRTLAVAIGWSLGAWIATIVSFAAAAQAVGIELSWAQAGLLAAGVALSTAIPAGPGYVGTFELAGVQIAAAFGVAAEPAFALTLLAHASSVIITSVLGGVSLIRLGWRRPGPAGTAAHAAEDGAGAGGA